MDANHTEIRVRPKGAYPIAEANLIKPSQLAGYQTDVYSWW
mgnify:FL=1